MGPDRLKPCLDQDPRQFVPPSGQSWTTLLQLKQNHRNVWQQDPVDPAICSVWTDSKFAIGQRAFLLQTPDGNILWDLITLLDEPTINRITSLGGLKAIVISHPHYYTTYVEWTRTFNCPVYMSSDDQEWLCQQPPTPQMLRLIDGPAGVSEPITGGITAIKTGGHFPGSLVLHWKRKLFIADSIVTVPVSLLSPMHLVCVLASLILQSAYTPYPRPPGQTSYTFQWSIPNMIPLPPSEILKMWQAIKPWSFNTTHGAFVGMDVRDAALKSRVLESMKIQVKGEGWEKHEILEEKVD